MGVFKDYSGIGRHLAAANSSDSRRPRRRRSALEIDSLEDRVVLSPFLVKNLADSGPGSLRQAIDTSNHSPGPNEIDFAHELSGTIKLTSGQLYLTRPSVRHPRIAGS
jgi:hypothetical protein